MKNYALLLLLAAATVISSCSKDDDGPDSGGTPTTCISPSNLVVNNITSNEALIEWNSVNDAPSYTLRYRVVGDSTWTLQNSTTNSLLLTSLLDNTNYECQVRTNCSQASGSNTSVYSGSVFFLTQAAVVSNTQNLCNKDWKLISFKLNGVDVTSQFFQPCDLDDFTRFLVDSTYTADEGPTKCDPADPQTTPGTWGWAASETKLIIDGDTANVLTNSGSSLKLGLSDATLGTIELSFGL